MFDKPLIVDLDGTLVHSDMLHESAIRVFRDTPFEIVRFPFLLAKGKAFLKKYLASRTEFDPKTLPYNEEFLEWLKQQRNAGRRLVLCTASDRLIADLIAEHLDIFDEVKLGFLSIFGKDYPTIDGTAVRDYIHVVDLAQGHLAALRYLQNQQAGITVNLGTGRGVSVKELVDTFALVTGKSVPYQFVDRRPGDVASCYADTRLALDTLGWRAELGVDRMCQDAWRWQSMNPNGY